MSGGAIAFVIARRQIADQAKVEGGRGEKQESPANDLPLLLLACGLRAPGETSAKREVLEEKRLGRSHSPPRPPLELGFVRDRGGMSTAVIAPPLWKATTKAFRYSSPYIHPHCLRLWSKGLFAGAKEKHEAGDPIVWGHRWPRQQPPRRTRVPSTACSWRPCCRLDASQPKTPSPSQAGLRNSRCRLTTRWSRPGQPSVWLRRDTSLGLAGRLISRPLGGMPADLTMSPMAINHSAGPFASAPRLALPRGLGAWPTNKQAILHARPKFTAMTPIMHH